MGVAAIINAVVETLNEERDVPIPSAIGQQHLDAHGAPPRLVWVPTQDSFGAPRNLGSPRSIKTRYAGVACRVWAEDFAACEQLVSELLIALDSQRDSSGNPIRSFYELRGADWLTESALISKGIACTLEFSFEIPIVAAPPTTTNISEVSGSCAMKNP